MIPGVEAVAGDGVDEADVRAAGAVVLAQDHPAEVVLADQCQAAAESLPDLCRYRRLARGAVPTQENEPGLRGAYHHPHHASGDH